LFSIDFDGDKSVSPQLRHTIGALAAWGNRRTFRHWPSFGTTADCTMNAARARVPAAGAGCGSWEITGRETTGYRHRKVRRGLPASRARHFTATGLPVFHRTTPAHRNPGFSPVSDPRFGIRSPIPSLAMCRRVVMLDGRAPRKRRSLFRCRKPPRTQIFGRTCPGGTAPRPPITTARDQPLIGRGYGGL